jgi:hypothetical protein
MEFKGTKGKWKESSSNVKGILISVKNPNRDICTVWQYDNDFLETREAKANALLISKAPEMLEMLKELKGVFDKYSVDFESEFFKYKQPLEQLIKEATEI